ncbi:hypothetical protein ACFL1Z_04200 [Thermodesulfobacteriota bacterium]
MMINPTDEGAIHKASRIMFSTGAMMLPAMMVRVAEEKMTAKEKFFEDTIKSLSFYIGELFSTISK